MTRKLLLLTLCLGSAGIVQTAFGQNVKVVNPDTQPVPVKIVSGGAGGAGDASAANQTAVQANAGADATKAVSVQGITGGKAVPVSMATLPTGASTAAGAANIATSQVTAGAAGTLAIARATRRQCTIKNTDATNTATIGPATVTTANGMPVKPGESITVRWVGLIQVIANAGSPVIAVMDEYD